MLFALHGTFALTGVVHAVGGALLPSLASTFHLNDGQSGLLFLLYFGGTSIGALLCRGSYARCMTLGLLALIGGCVGVAVTGRMFLEPMFLVLGICVGVPMSAVSMFVGRNFAGHTAATLTFLNFSWSGGALLAPLLAAQLLTHHSYRAAYGLLAVAAAAAAVACGLLLRDEPEKETGGAGITSEAAPVAPQSMTMRNVRVIALFSFLAFLEVGIENTTGAWLATYALRSMSSGAAMAAAFSSLYWCGFLASRGLSSLLLLWLNAMRVLQVAVAMGLLAALLLAGFPALAGVAMLLLGVSLAPIFPLLLSTFFARAQRTADSRWVLAICGFGGSVLPWVTGWISARSGSLRMGLITVPAMLLVMACVLPVLGGPRRREAAGS